jgi:2-iminobutanoate/2-iminopropanoate deaminase
MSEAIKTTSAPQPGGHHSQGVRAGRFLFVSGQLPISHDGSFVKGTVAEETAQTLENIRAIVEATDGAIADIMQCTICICRMDDWTEVCTLYMVISFPGCRYCPFTFSCLSKTCTLAHVSRFRRSFLNRL